jgi:hypothetical protein
MTKQTTIEWMYGELKTCLHREEVSDMIDELREQLLAMEKEQAREIYIAGFNQRDEVDKGLFFNPLAVTYCEKVFSQYYDETYKGDKQ